MACWWAPFGCVPYRATEVGRAAASPTPTTMWNRDTHRLLARGLTGALLAGPWIEEEARARAREALGVGPRARWLTATVAEVFRAYHRPPCDRPRELAAYIETTLQRRRAAGQRPPQVAHWFFFDTAMGRMPWPVPAIASVGALAEFLQLDTPTLDWLADVRSLERGAQDERLRNYRYAALPRAGGPVRVIERPKARLKAAQRRILHEILDWIPAHDAAHGFVRGRSAASHARAHVGQYALMRLDLEDFFASVPAGRAYATFRTAGYPEAVAHTLTGMTTNVVSRAFWFALTRPQDPRHIAPHHRLGRRLAYPHLPQGAPTSPALANLAAFGLDRRLTALAASLGLVYTRYADDLAFSGPRSLVRAAPTLRRQVAEIAAAESFRVNPRKSSLTTRAGRQATCGIVVNERLNIARHEYDRLKATLHNVARDGPAAHNREAVTDFRAHLLGRIAWVTSLNPQRGHKLRDRYEAITWDA